jgi:hypothetical protein
MHSGPPKQSHGPCGIPFVVNAHILLPRVTVSVTGVHGAVSGVERCLPRNLGSRRRIAVSRARCLGHQTNRTDAVNLRSICIDLCGEKQKSMKVEAW